MSNKSTKTFIRKNRPRCRGGHNSTYAKESRLHLLWKAYAMKLENRLINLE